MNPSLTIDAASLITWCMHGTRPAQIYIDRLGLPQYDEDRISKGPLQFEKHAAQSCGALYRSICGEAAKILLDHFQTKDELRQAPMKHHLALASQITEPLLSAHGPTIWGTSAPYMTRTSQPVYPQYLRHNNSDDRER